VERFDQKEAGRYNGALASVRYSEPPPVRPALPGYRELPGTESQHQRRSAELLAAHFRSGVSRACLNGWIDGSSNGQRVGVDTDNDAKVASVQRCRVDGTDRGREGPAPSEGALYGSRGVSVDRWVVQLSEALSRVRLHYSALRAPPVRVSFPGY
jgi:hypothetical protein